MDVRYIIVPEDKLETYITPSNITLNALTYKSIGRISFLKHVPLSGKRE